MQPRKRYKKQIKKKLLNYQVTPKDYGLIGGIVVLSFFVGVLEGFGIAVLFPILQGSGAGKTFGFSSALRNALGPVLGFPLRQRIICVAILLIVIHIVQYARHLNLTYKEIHVKILFIFSFKVKFLSQKAIINTARHAYTGSAI